MMVETEMKEMEVVEEKVSPWIICVFIDDLEETKLALGDLHQQTVEPHVLAIDNGSTLETWEAVRRWARDYPRLHLWRHNPSLPALSATWNYALDFVWSTGAEEAMVVNHDVRVSGPTYAWLLTALKGEDALFVSAIGVLLEQFVLESQRPVSKTPGDLPYDPARGGPDFSCFLISKECHERYRFDENFTPAYCEDLDYHRRMLLGGDGKKIFSLNIPFVHTASGVLKSRTEEERRELERRIGEGSRKYYEEKWGGPVNQEKFFSPFGEGPTEVQDANDPWDPTTPELYRRYGYGEKG